MNERSSRRHQPAITTERLLLRPFTPDDVADVVHLAGSREVADTTLNVPHPYSPAIAEIWIARQMEDFRSGRAINYAIAIRETNTLIGTVSLHYTRRDANAELGYWIGVDHWGQGYCTEAAAALLSHAFEREKIHRIHAAHFARNPASGRVLQKLGMTREGTLREHVIKWNRFEDMVKYGILEQEWRGEKERMRG